MTPSEVIASRNTVRRLFRPVGEVSSTDTCFSSKEVALLDCGTIVDDLRSDAKEEKKRKRPFCED